MFTPWGTSQDDRTIAPGIVAVSTPSHGGFWISLERYNQMAPEYQALAYPGLTNDGAWFEEDSAWVAVVLSFWPEFEACYQRILQDYRQLQPTPWTFCGITWQSYTYEGRVLYDEDRQWYIEYYLEKLTSEYKRAQQIYNTWYQQEAPCTWTTSPP